MRDLARRLTGADEIRWAQIIMPVVVITITLAVVMMPLERSGWNVMSTVRFLAFFLTFVCIFGVFSLGLNVHWGYTGIFNFGVLAFFLVGANTAAIITKSPAESDFVEYIGGFGEDLDLLPFLASDQWLPFLVGVGGAMLICGVLAFFVSIPALRLREDYLAIVTIGIAEMVRRITIEERWLVNGSRGLPGIPRPLSDLASTSDYTYVILAISAVVLLLVFLTLERGIRSPWGRVLRAVREDELTAAASGKNVGLFKSQSFVVGAMIMGVGGAIYAYANSSISPSTFTHFFATFIFWAMLIVGGSGNNKGAVLGAYIVWGFWTITAQLKGYPLPEFLDFRIFFLRELIIGLLIVGALLLRPQGLLPEERRVSIWLDRRARGGPKPTPSGEAAAPD